VWESKFVKGDVEVFVLTEKTITSEVEEIASTKENRLKTDNLADR